MAQQFSTTARNAMLSAISTAVGTGGQLRVYTGSPPANAAATATGTLLVTETLASTPFTTPASGSMTLASLPLTTTASAAGTAGYFRIVDSGGNCHDQGTITVTGGGGDMTFDNPALAANQQTNITGFTLTAPGA